MKPHRRKDTPPRREHTGEQPESNEEVDPSVQQEPEEVYYDESAAGYDPGQALADPESGQSYVDPNQQYVDPGQAYVDPNQQYVDPGQAYVDPNQQYVDPSQAYVDPNQQYGDPGQAYVDTGQEYADPGHAYAEEPAGIPAPPPPVSVPQPTPPVASGGEPAPVSRTPKRKVKTKGGPTRRSTAASRRRQPQPAYGGGVSVMGVFLFLVALAMLAAVAFVILPKDLSAVQGYPVNPLTESGEPRNLLAEAQKIMVSRDADLEISEQEVNEYLNYRLQGKQDGIMGSLVKFRGVYVDFSPERAEVIVEREIFGQPITLTSEIRTERFQRQVLYRNAGWTIGKIEFSSRNIKPIIDMFFRLRTSFQEEFETMRQMADVRFEQDMVILDATL